MVAQMAEKIAATIIDDPSAIAASLGALSIPSSRLFCYQSIRRHYYGFLLTGEKTLYQHDKGFHVSPFNPINQQYHWRVEVHPKRYASADDNPEQNGFDVVIDIELTDSRGKVFNAGVSLTGVQLDEASVITAIKRRPWMSATSLLRIYWQAFKLYALKRVPYQAYNQRLPQ